MISCITRGMVSTRTGRTEPLTIQKSAVKSGALPGMITWTTYQYFLENTTFSGCIRVIIHAKDVFIFSLQKVTHVIDVTAECSEHQEPLCDFRNFLLETKISMQPLAR